MSTANLSGQMTIVDLSGITIWNGKREVKDPTLKQQIQRCHSVVSIKAEFPQDKLKVFSTIKQRIRRSLEDEGYSFMSGFAIPEHRTKEVMSRIDEHIQEAIRAKADFLKNYDQYRDVALSEAGDDQWRDVLDEAMLSKEQVEDRIHFEVTPLQVSLSQYDPSAMDRKLGGLRDQIVGNAMRMAERFLEDYQNPAGLKKKSCSDLKVLRQKIQGFQFLNGVDGKAVATLLDHAIQAVNVCPTHSLPEEVYWQVMGPVAIIANEKRLQRYLDGDIDLDKIVKGPQTWDEEVSPFEDGPTQNEEPAGDYYSAQANDDPFVFDLEEEETPELNDGFTIELDDEFETSEEEDFVFEIE